MATRKRKGPGRPPLPKGQAQTERLELRLTKAAKRRWERAAKSAGLTLSEWAKRALDAAAE